ncbi:MAG: phosphodiester glycosidase family protein [Actinomycetota bacterium]|nr:phosphodiester glycosidase family protein [Actinomycetota bacterium]
MRKTFFAFFFSLALLSGTHNAFAAPSVSVPDGYTITTQRQLAPGLTHVQMASFSPPERVNIALLAHGSKLELRTVLSNDAIAEDGPRLERTSSMCLRIRCVVAVNGDFYAEAGQPVGGLVSGGELVRTPNNSHHQLLIQPGQPPVAETAFPWKGTLVSTDLQGLSLDGVNVDRGTGKLVLYTPAFGPSTRTNDFGVELTIDIVQPSGPLRLGRTALVRVTGIRENAGDTSIPAGGAVLSGHNERAYDLIDLWHRIQTQATSAEALLRIESTPELAESVGGTPILVRNGSRWFGDENRSFYKGRHPRTIVGWNDAGDVFLVTVDGRQSGDSVGMTLGEAASFMIGLGATDALNLDGGGSTTFVTRGAVLNRPSDRIVIRSGHEQIVREAGAGEHVLGYVERPVSVALAIVAPGDRTSGLGDPFAAGPITLPDVRTAVPSSPAVARTAGTAPAVVSPMGVELPATSHDDVAGAIALIVIALAAIVGRRRLAPAG